MIDKIVKLLQKYESKYEEKRQDYRTYYDPKSRIEMECYDRFISELEKIIESEIDEFKEKANDTRTNNL